MPPITIAHDVYLSVRLSGIHVINKSKKKLRMNGIDFCDKILQGKVSQFACERRNLLFGRLMLFFFAFWITHTLDIAHILERFSVLNGARLLIHLPALMSVWAAFFHYDYHSIFSDVAGICHSDALTKK